MNESVAGVLTPPKWFWWASSAGLVWNLLGVLAFFNQMFMDLTELSPEQQEFYSQFPVWANAGFALAVFGGVLGCVALLLRREWAFLMLVICIAGIVVQNGYSFSSGDGIAVFGTLALVMPLLTFGIAVALAWLAKYAQQNGWLGTLATS